MNRTVYNIKYDIMTLSDKSDNMEKSGKINHSFGESFDDDTFQKELFIYIPLETEEDLAIFENKLLNHEFRKKMVMLYIKYKYL